MAQDKLASVEIYSDLICPWCYIGKRYFERGLEISDLADRVEIRWKPFELNPSMPLEGMESAVKIPSDNRRSPHVNLGR